MNQIALIIKRSNERHEEIGKKVSDPLERIRGQREEAKIQLSAINAYVNAYAIESKNNRSSTRSISVIKPMERIGMMDGHTVLSGLGDPEEDRVKCIEQDKIILRAECLDYSGSHIDECRGCETGRDTKRKLLPVQS